MLNLICIEGRLVSDPTSRRLPSGTAVCEVTVACDRTIKKDGKQALFIKASFFGAQAENVLKYFHKGRPIIVIGRLECDVYLDKKTRETKKELYIAATSFEFPVANGKAEAQQGDPASAAIQQPQAQAEPSGIVGSNLEGLDVIEDDLPF